MISDAPIHQKLYTLFQNERQKHGNGAKFLVGVSDIFGALL
jgi:hypothetical protein